MVFLPKLVPLCHHLVNRETELLLAWQLGQSVVLHSTLGDTRSVLLIMLNNITWSMAVRK